MNKTRPTKIKHKKTSKIRLIDVFTIMEMALEAFGTMSLVFLALVAFTDADILICMLASIVSSIFVVLVIAMVKGELYEERNR